MKVKLMEFNPVDGLQSEEEIAQYLADCFQDDNPAVFVTALGYVAKSKGIANIAQEHRVEQGEFVQISFRRQAVALGHHSSGDEVVEHQAAADRLTCFFVSAKYSCSPAHIRSPGSPTRRAD